MNRHHSGVGNTQIGKICHLQICSFVKPFCFTRDHPQYGQQYSPLWTLSFLQATRARMNELRDVTASLPPSSFRSFLFHSHFTQCSSPLHLSASDSKSHQVYLLSCISQECGSSISSTSRVRNLTQRTVLGLSFTFAEYLICSSRKVFISREHNGVTNCFKSAGTSNKVQPSWADLVMWTGCTISTTLIP